MKTSNKMVQELIEAYNEQLEANAKLAAANAAKAEADRKVTELSQFLAKLCQYNVIYDAGTHFLQKISETSVQIIPKEKMPTRPVADLEIVSEPVKNE